ncbi:hypothetical protein SeLEV6574_g05064 [Synchytrium endobioticum]|uniref:Uncharacterized protein n=1 Tax=Synchytrium endobioticum TaxID=286115 RepID=A0A507CWC1_9FUNG|nr:hypothetical protein SeLEV6574_g05064 [Synchytrium endobioticum]
MAQIEYTTHIMTRAIGRNAVYYYSALIFTLSLIRDYYVLRCMERDAASLKVDPDTAFSIGYALILVGLFLNFWVLQVLGVRGMYNGDSFGFLFDAPITNGPFQFFSDPQYVGASMAFLGYAIKVRSTVGLGLALVAMSTYFISVNFIENPHMHRIYSNAAKNQNGLSNGKSSANGATVANGNGICENKSHKEE